MLVSSTLMSSDDGHLLRHWGDLYRNVGVTPLPVFAPHSEVTSKAFTQQQVSNLMDYANSLPETSWKRWLLSLGIITGGRLKEICQLTTCDVVTKESGLTAIHINEAGEGKSIKNKQIE